MLRCTDRKTRNSRTWSLLIPFYEFNYYFFHYFFLVERCDEQGIETWNLSYLHITLCCCYSIEDRFIRHASIRQLSLNFAEQTSHKIKTCLRITLPIKLQYWQKLTTCTILNLYCLERFFGTRCQRSLL